MASIKIPKGIRKYLIDNYWEVWVGKTDEDNDYLSLKLAAPKDLWFHVKGMPGSHVVLRLPDKELPPRDIVETAAAVAAYYSKARNGGWTAVNYTQAKFVKKPKGAKPGTVIIRNEKTVKVKPALPGDEI